MLFSSVQRRNCRNQVSINGVNKSQVEVDARRVGFNHGGNIVMQMSKAEISRLKIQVRKIEMRLKMPRIVAERICKVVKCFGKIVVLVIKYAEIAVGIRNTFTAVDGFK